MSKDIKKLQDEIKLFVYKYGLDVAIRSTSLSVYHVRKTYNDAEPNAKHLAAVVDAYRQYDKKAANQASKEIKKVA